MSEKLALKNELNSQLNRLTREIEELKKQEVTERTFDYDVKLSILTRNRDDVLRLITICVDRNKF